MPKISSLPSTLYCIDECPDLMADAYIGDEVGNLVFLSLWGRDTAIQQFLPRLTLGRNEDGLDHFHLVNEQGASFAAFIHDIERLDKRTTRSLRRTLFGSMVHLWLFDKRCLAPDQTNASALALCPKADTEPDQQLWSLVRQTCPLPLLDHWRDTVLQILRSKSMLTPLKLSLGPLQGHRLLLDVPALTSDLGDLIRCGDLTAFELFQTPCDSAPPLRLAA